MLRHRRTGRQGFVVVETLAAMGVVAILLTMVFLLFSNMRRAARVTMAETRLKQVSAGLELYFRKYRCYPPKGSNLAEELAPFVASLEVFSNPLLEELTPGETISSLYRQPTLLEIDSPFKYVTAMVSDDVETALILSTGDRVERRPAGMVLTLLRQRGADSNVLQGTESTTSTETYVVVRDSKNKIKFESTIDCLGEDGAKETDEFVFTVIGDGPFVLVTTKAGTDKDKFILPTFTPGYGVHDELGFVTRFIGKEGGQYTFTVTSVDNPKALSHIEFHFIGGKVRLADEYLEVTRSTYVEGDGSWVTTDSIKRKIDQKK